MKRKPFKSDATAEDGYLVAAFELCGNVACRIGQGQRKRRLAFAAADLGVIERIRDIIDDGGSIYTDSTVRLEFYRKTTIDRVIARIRSLVSATKLKQIMEYDDASDT